MIEINEKTMAASPTHKVTSETQKKNYVRNVIFGTWNILHGQKHTSSTNKQPTPGLFQAKVTYAISGNVQFPAARLRDEHVRHVPTKNQKNSPNELAKSSEFHWFSTSPKSPNITQLSIPDQRLAKWHRSPRGTATAQWWRSQGSKEPHQPAPGGQGHWG